MSDAQTGATGNSAQPPQVTESATKQSTAEIVAQVKEARARDVAGRGNEALAKVLRSDGKSDDAVAVVSAETTAAPAAPADPPAAPPADDPAEKRKKLSRELAELAEKGIQKRREREEAKRRQVQEQKTRTDYEARLAELNAEKERLAAATKDPLAFLEKAGVPPEEIAKRVLRRGSPQAAAEELRAELETIKNELKSRDERESVAAKQREEEQIRQANLRQRAQNEQAFVKLAADDAKYPSLNALYSPGEIIQKAYEIVSLAKEGDPDAFYEDSEIADLLEDQASKRLEKLRERFGSAPKVPEVPKVSEAQAAGQKSRTLVSTMQSENASDPAAFKKLPKWKQNQILGERLKAAQEAKRSAK